MVFIMYYIVWNPFIENFVSTFISVFISVLFAFIVKDFYDVFMQRHIRNRMSSVNDIIDNISPKTKKHGRIHIKGHSVTSDAKKLFEDSIK